MRVRLWLVCALLTPAFSFWPGLAAAQRAGVTVFENVRVLTMSDSGVLERATVVVAGDRISSVSISAAQPPAGARTIDGSGMTLLPGLADMHVHYRWADFGPLFLINGVTTVRDTAGNAGNFTGDALAKAGAIAGPHIYASGPLMDGEPPTFPGSFVVTSPEQARGAVGAQAAAGFRAIKLYNNLDAETFKAAVATAQSLDMQVWAHTPVALTYEDMLELGVDSIEHLFAEQYSLMDERRNPALPPNNEGLSRWQGVDEARIPALAARTAAAGLWNVPTLTVHKQLMERALDADNFLRQPEVTYLGQGVIQMWRASPSALAATAELKKREQGAPQRWVKALYDAGAGLLVGTDTPNPFIVPGYSFHEEMANLSDAGIPHDGLLRMATSEAARFLSEQGEFGVVVAGARADLIVVRGDPLRDLAALRSPSYVMVNGHLWDRASIQREVDALACGANPPTPPPFGENGWVHALRQRQGCQGGQSGLGR